MHLFDRKFYEEEYKELPHGITFFLATKHDFIELGTLMPKIINFGNPNRKTSLHSEKSGVWCALSRTRIIGLIFFTSTIDANMYQDIIA